MQVNNDMMDYRMELFGFKTYQNDCKNLRFYSECIDFLKHNSLRAYKPNLEKIHLKTVKKEVFKNFQNLLSDVDLEVKYLSNHSFARCCAKDDYRERIEKKVKKQNAFHLPVRYNNNASCCFNISSKCNNYPVTIDKIKIPKDYPESSYMHEITHALMQRNKGTIENYLHFEFMPIFLEQIYAFCYYRPDDLKQVILSRLENMKQSLEIPFLSDLLKIERDKYLLSGFLATYAFDKYEQSSFDKKKMMLEEIKRVLIGEKTLERMLEEEEIHFYSEDILKSLEKTYHKVNQ